jgi:hypothetical protein
MHLQEIRNNFGIGFLISYVSQSLAFLLLSDIPYLYNIINLSTLIGLISVFALNTDEIDNAPESDDDTYDDMPPLIYTGNTRSNMHEDTYKNMPSLGPVRYTSDDTPEEMYKDMPPLIPFGEANSNLSEDIYKDMPPLAPVGSISRTFRSMDDYLNHPVKYSITPAAETASPAAETSPEEKTIPAEETAPAPTDENLSKE